MRKIIRNKKGVSEIVGVAILLGMAIALFTIVQLMAINFPFNNPNPSVHLTATIDGQKVIILHQGGESLPLDTKIILVIIDPSGTPGSPIYTAPNDPSPNMDEGSIGNSWNIGEKLSYDTGSSLSNKEVEIAIVDTQSNAIIMQGTVRGG